MFKILLKSREPLFVASSIIYWDGSELGLCCSTTVGNCIALLSYTSPPVRKTTSPWWCHLWTLQACLPQQPPFLQHVLWRCCNPPGIPSSMVEILLFNSFFHDGVDPVSVSTLKLPLGVIGVVTLKPRASPILPLCIYKTSSYIVIR